MVVVFPMEKWRLLTWLGFSILAGCGEVRSPLADSHLQNQTQIFLGSEEYALTPKQDDRKPVDIDFVLTKAKDISVGVASALSKAPVQNEERSFTPASITKMVTTAMALRELGPDFQFESRIAFALNGGVASDMVVVADGDPTVGIDTFRAGAPKRMEEIALALKARGVRDVQGSIQFVSVDPRLDVSVSIPGLSTEDASECYAARSLGFNYHENCAGLRVSTKGVFAWPGMMTADGFESNVALRPGERTDLMLEAALSADRLVRGFRLSGTYGGSLNKARTVNLAVGHSGAWYATAMLGALRANQISVTGVAHLAMSNGERASALQTFARYQNTALVVKSASLDRIVEATNKPSDNFFADALFKAVGRKQIRQGDLQSAGRSAMRDAIQDWLQADGHPGWSGDLLLNDGAGLSMDNRATPRAYLAILRQIAKDRNFPVFLQSLPIAGVDGTLTDRMRNTVAMGRVRAKTGTLKGSYQLAGYIPRSREGATEYVPFVILTSTTEENRDEVRRFQDALVVKMMESL